MAKTREQQCAWCKTRIQEDDYKMFEWGKVCLACWNEKIRDAMTAEEDLEKLLAGRPTYRSLCSVDVSESSFLCHHCKTRIEEVGAPEFVVASRHFGTRACCSAECALEYLEPYEEEPEEEPEDMKNLNSLSPRG
jgi:hypothetical protein